MSFPLPQDHEAELHKAVTTLQQQLAAVPEEKERMKAQFTAQLEVQKKKYETLIEQMKGKVSRKVCPCPGGGGTTTLLPATVTLSHDPAREDLIFCFFSRLACAGRCPHSTWLPPCPTAALFAPASATCRTTYCTPWTGTFLL